MYKRQAFESGLAAKILGPVAAVVFGGTMTLITVVTTGIVSPTIRNLDLTEAIKEQEKEA